jgi:putative two-component system response regulator
VAPDEPPGNDEGEERRRLEDMVRSRTQDLWEAIAELERVKEELRASREETVYRLSIAAELKDDETPRHIARMTRYCALLAQRAGADEEQAELIRVASIMHDVGKIGVPDAILLKPGPLTPEERLTMQTHAEIGHRILSGSTSPFLEVAAAVALTHHEWFDGSGYPQGLSGPTIPREGRIAAVADVFDALTSDKVFRKAYPIGKAVEMMKEGRGTQFDPDLLDAFLDSLDEALGIREEFPEIHGGA